MAQILPQAAGVTLWTFETGVGSGVALRFERVAAGCVKLAATMAPPFQMAAALRRAALGPAVSHVDWYARSSAAIGSTCARHASPLQARRVLTGSVRCCVCRLIQRLEG